MTTYSVLRALEERIRAHTDPELMAVLDPEGDFQQLLDQLDAPAAPPVVESFPSTYKPIHRLLNRLWTRDVGTPGYVKKDWQLLEFWIETLWRATGRSLRIEPSGETHS